MKKISLSVGIPAFNEEKNIGGVILRVLHQKSKNYLLKEVLVFSDGSTDATGEIVRTINDKHPEVQLIDDGRRKGKTSRLNEIYQKCSGDYLLTLDADVFFSTRDQIDLMLEEAKKSQADVVAGNLIPTQVSGFFGHIIYTSYLLWDNIRTSIKGGDHISNLYGAATLLKTSFAKTVKYPTSITCDEEYLYVFTKLYGKFSFAKKTAILFHPVSDFNEFRVHSGRVLKEREALVPYFEEPVTQLHSVPLKYKVYGLIKTFIKSPVFTILALGLLSLIHTFPVHDILNEQGLWQITTSTKKAFE